MTFRISGLAAARLTLGLVAIGLSTAILLSPSPARAATVTVAVEDYDFAPASRPVSVGDEVRWAFSGDQHSVTSRVGLFDSGIKDAGGSFQFTFKTAGTFRYYCVVHPDLMSGTIVVKAAAATPRPTVRPTASPRPTPRPTATPRPTPASTPTATPTRAGANSDPSPSPVTPAAASPSPATSEAIVEPPGPSSTAAPPPPSPSEPASATDTTPILTGAVLLVAIVATGGLALARRRRAT